MRHANYAIRSKAYVIRIFFLCNSLWGNHLHFTLDVISYVLLEFWMLELDIICRPKGARSFCAAPSFRPSQANLFFFWKKCCVKHTPFWDNLGIVGFLLFKTSTTVVLLLLLLLLAVYYTRLILTFVSKYRWRGIYWIPLWIYFRAILFSCCVSLCAGGICAVALFLSLNCCLDIHFRCVIFRYFHSLSGKMYCGYCSRR